MDADAAALLVLALPPVGIADSTGMYPYTQLPHSA